jgi:hypothetical protein
MDKSSKVVTKGVALDRDLVDTAMATARDRLALAVEAPTNRDLFRECVRRWLPHVLECLREAGVRPAAPGNQRPRSFDPETWAAMERAQEEVGYPVIGLLRCCLELTRGRGL